MINSYLPSAVLCQLSHRVIYFALTKYVTRMGIIKIKAFISIMDKAKVAATFSHFLQI